MTRKRTLLITAGLFVLCWSISASAQPQNIGTFDKWTRTFSRTHQLSDVTHLRQVRASRQDAFDRIIFEFDGSIPNYNISYFASRFYEDEDGKHRIKIAGAAFLKVELFVIPYDERQDAFAKAKGYSPAGRIRMPSVREIDDRGTWEGFYDFFVGISSRKPFRVSELSNPARLVIDVHH